MRPYNVVGLQTNEIDLSPLRGAQRKMDITEKVELPPFGGLEFPYPNPVVFHVERIDAALCISGSAEVVLTGECDRCLERFETRRTYEVDESFNTGASADPFDEGAVVRDDKLDLTDFVRQVVDAALPLVTVCRDDCAGLCPACGSNLNEGTCDCGVLTKGDHG